MSEITLCTPDDNKTCFACCPPIRPPGYEHIQYKNIIKRVLRENTKAFDPCEDNVRPITGFSCWALGYLDSDCSRIGCLLHPSRNRGKDLRYRVDFGEKCQREACPESLTFAELTPPVQNFLLTMTKDMDSFEYSSREHNPLFRVLGWGATILMRIALNCKGKMIDKDAFLKTYPVLGRTKDPRPHAYMLEYVLMRLGPDILKGDAFAQCFHTFAMKLFGQLSAYDSRSGDTFTHKLEMEASFQDMLRLGLNIKKIDREWALYLKKRIDQELAHFVKNIY